MRVCFACVNGFVIRVRVWVDIGVFCVHGVSIRVGECCISLAFSLSLSLSLSPPPPNFIFTGLI